MTLRAGRGAARRPLFYCRADADDTEAETEEGAEAEGETEAEESEGTVDEGDDNREAELLAKLEGVDDAVLEEVKSLFARSLEAEENYAAAAEEVAASKDSYIRLNADFDNFRKRTIKEKEQIVNTTKGNMLEALLPVVDNFELAKGNLKCETEGEEKIDASYQGLYKQMVETFRGLGLTAVPTEGEPFNPEIHDAIMREPSNEVADGIILQEFRRGFTFNGALLRPAMVKVAQAMVEAAPVASGEGEEEVSEETEDKKTEEEASA